LLLVGGASRTVFEPQAVPADYLRRAAIRLVLRPKTFYSNALDLTLLESFITAQVPRYVDLQTPTVIISGERDTMVSPQINARALAAVLPRAKLVLLKNIGHMPHHAAPEVVAAAVDELLPNVAYSPGRRRRLPMALSRAECEQAVASRKTFTRNGLTPAVG